MGTGPGKTDVLPLEELPNIKFVMSSRHPLEVAKSLRAFFSKIDPDFRAMWGGFPPTYQDIESLLKELKPGGLLQDMYFGYVKAWWPYVNLSNVLPLHYSDMVKDLPGLVDKLASFVGVVLQEEEKAKVVEKCTFKH